MCCITLPSPEMLLHWSENQPVSAAGGIKASLNLKELLTGSPAVAVSVINRFLKLVQKVKFWHKGRFALSPLLAEQH